MDSTRLYLCFVKGRDENTFYLPEHYKKSFSLFVKMTAMGMPMWVLCEQSPSLDGTHCLGNLSIPLVSHFHLFFGFVFPQRARFKAVESLKDPKKRVIVVCTDVAARGLDIPTVSTVVHYDVARAVDTFVHRSGRTAVSLTE